MFIYFELNSALWVFVGFRIGCSAYDCGWVDTGWVGTGWLIGYACGFVVCVYVSFDLL